MWVSLRTSLGWWALQHLVRVLGFGSGFRVLSFDATYYASLISKTSQVPLVNTVPTVRRLTVDLRVIGHAEEVEWS